MANEIRPTTPPFTERPDQVIKSEVHNTSTELKVKVKNAVQEVITKIKEKHLS